MYASLCKINRLKKIETFSKDILVKNILNLDQPVSDSTLSERFKTMGEKSSRGLEHYQLEENRKFLSKQPSSRFLFLNQAVFTLFLSSVPTWEINMRSPAFQPSFWSMQSFTAHAKLLAYAFSTSKAMQNHQPTFI